MKFSYMSKSQKRLQKKMRREERYQQIAHDLKKPRKFFAWFPIDNVCDINNVRRTVWLETVWISYSYARLFKDGFTELYCNYWKLREGLPYVTTYEYPAWLKSIQDE